MLGREGGGFSPQSSWVGWVGSASSSGLAQATGQGTSPESDTEYQSRDEAGIIAHGSDNTRDRKGLPSLESSFPI